MQFPFNGLKLSNKEARDSSSTQKPIRISMSVVADLWLVVNCFIRLSVVFYNFLRSFFLFLYRSAYLVTPYL